jgi:glutathione peroxidase
VKRKQIAVAGRAESNARLASIKWNFTKFLVGKDGVPIKRYAPADKPESMESDVEAALR